VLGLSVTAPSTIPIRPDAGEHRDQDHRVLLIAAMARDPFSLEGKVAFVTGANSGLGLTVALSLCDAGAQVVIGARRAARNAEALASLAPGAAAFTVDVTDEGSVERALAGTVERFGHLDILVNNADDFKERGRAYRRSATRSFWRRDDATSGRNYPAKQLAAFGRPRAALGDLATYRPLHPYWLDHVVTRTPLTRMPR
jgi:short chain dehydrogenase